MTARPNPVPPANRSDKGPGEPAHPPKSNDPNAAPPGPAPNDGNLKGGPGNTKVNTTNQGYQQDR